MTGGTVSAFVEGEPVDEVGLGYLLPLLSCEDEARTLDSELFVLQVAAASPLVSTATRARVGETAEAWRSFRRSQSGFMGCFGPGAVRRVAEFAVAIERLRADVATDSLRPPPSVVTTPTMPVAAPVPASPWLGPPPPAPIHASSGWRAPLILGALGLAGAYAYHLRKRSAR